MIEWYIEISKDAPQKFKEDKYINLVNETAEPFMNKVFDILKSKKELPELSQFNKALCYIIDEFPLMEARTYNGEFFIKYNRWTFIKLKHKTNTIYRDIKIEKLLS
jgi:hypothetical protein